jgi:hypothetical protein
MKLFVMCGQAIPVLRPAFWAFNAFALAIDVGHAVQQFA